MTAPVAQAVPRYLAVGAVNTLVGLGVIFAAKAFASAEDALANVLGYGAGLVLSFVLNRQWTFRHQGESWIAFYRFVLVFAVSYLINLGTVLALVRLGTNSYVAQTIGIVPYTAIGFLASRHFVFSDGKA